MPEWEDYDFRKVTKDELNEGRNLCFFFFLKKQKIAFYITKLTQSPLIYIYIFIVFEKASYIS